jgi:hypothetical protein
MPASDPTALLAKVEAALARLQLFEGMDIPYPWTASDVDGLPMVFDDRGDSIVSVMDERAYFEPELAALIAHAPEWLSALVACVREAEQRQVACCDCGDTEPGTDRYCSQCRNGAIAVRVEQAEAAAHRAGYEAAIAALRDEAKKLRTQAHTQWEQRDREQSDYSSDRAWALEDAADIIAEALPLPGQQEP